MRGTDAHSKNFGLLHEAAGSRLAPLYDQISFLPFLARNERSDRLGSAMGIAGETLFARIDDARWARLARENDIDPEPAVTAARSVLERAPAALATVLDRPCDLPGHVARRWRDDVAAAAELALSRGAG